MHEWALAESVISSVIKFAKEKKVEIREVTISMGELQQVDRGVFDFALKEIMKAMGLNLKIKLKNEKAIFKCKECGNEWNFEYKNLREEEKESIHFIPETVHSYVKCPKCGSPDFIIKRGRGIWLSIKGE